MVFGRGLNQSVWKWPGKGLTNMDSAISTSGVIRNDSHTSGVSWAAVIAGAFAAAALSLALLALGTGIGFSAVSPWSDASASASMIGWTAVIWLVLTQMIASSIGGYLAGRLRTRWVNVHTHEVYFRDTAHGFLVWAVGLVVTAAFLTSAAASLVGGASHSVGTSANAGHSRETVGPNAYFIDSLLRSAAAGSGQENAALRGEVELIFAHGLKEGTLPPVDRSYLAQIVKGRTGASEPEAGKRVDDAFADSQQAADKARKAVAHSMYWTFLALLVGAFCASFAATIGGRQRDNVVVI
jgi:hypothetical protein